MIKIGKGKKALSRRNGLPWRIFRLLFLMGVSFIIVYPAFVILTTSFKDSKDLIDPTVVFLPRHFTLSNFSTVFQAVDYPRIFFNSVLFTSLISLLQTSSCALVGYGFARFQFRGRGLLFAASVSTLVVPPQVILLPLYLRFRYFNIFETFKLGGVMTGIALTDTVWPFLLMSLTASGFKNGLFIFLLRQHFRGLPSVLEEAAYIDGCGVFRTFFKIMLPGAVPMLVTTFLFAFVWQWNDYFYSTLLAPGLPLLNMELLGVSFNNIQNLLGVMSTSVLQAPKFILLILPVVILYLVLQKRFTESIIKSGIVG